MIGTTFLNTNRLLSQKKESRNQTAEIIELTRQMRDEQTTVITKKITKELINLKKGRKEYLDS